MQRPIPILRFFTMAAGLSIAMAYSAQAATLAIVAPQSGPYASLGAQIVAGASAGAKKYGHDIAVVAENCEQDSGAGVAAQITAARADVAIGFLCIESLTGALPALKQSGTVAITLSVRSGILMEDALKQGWPFFRLAPNERSLADKLGEILLRDWQGKAFALVEDGTILGRELTENIRQKLEPSGMKPVFTDTYRPGQEQQIGLVRRLAKAGASEVFIGGDRNDAAIIARDARSEKIALTVLGGDAMHAANQPVSLPEGVLAVGLIDYAALPTAAQASALLRGDGVEPEGYALPAFAAVELVDQALRQSKPLSTALLREGPYQTAIGPIAFTDRHELDVNPYGLQVWRGGRFQPASSASTRD